MEYNPHSEALRGWKVIVVFKGKKVGRSGLVKATTIEYWRLQEKDERPEEIYCHRFPVSHHHTKPIHLGPPEPQAKISLFVKT